MTTQDYPNRPQRSPLCTCLPDDTGTCVYHTIDEAEGAASSAAIETYMRQVGLDPDDNDNYDIRNQIGILLQPALDAFLDAFAATPGWTVKGLRAFLKEHPSP